MSMIITLASIFAFVAETHYKFQQLRLSNGTLLPAPEPEPAVATAMCCCAGLVEEEHITNHSADTAVNTTHNETGQYLICYSTNDIFKTFSTKL